MREAMAAESKTLLPAAADLKTFNADFRKRHAASVPHAVAATQAAVRFLGEERGKGAQALVGLLDVEEGVVLEQALGVLEALRAAPFGEARDGDGDGDVVAFKAKAAKKFPLATAFASS
jgi:hypothetical protein